MQPLGLDLLLKLRLVVARFGEMDVAQWWNTKGMLGRHGELALRRGFSKTHHFAQARVVFAVARDRCCQLFELPECMTLWSLPADLENQFEERWHLWLDQGEKWSPFFEGLKEITGDDLLSTLSEFDLLTTEQAEVARSLKRSLQGRSVLLPGFHSPDDEVVTLLAAGFARGERGNPAVPYARLVV